MLKKRIAHELWSAIIYVIYHGVVHNRVYDTLFSENIDFMFQKIKSALEFYTYKINFTNKNHMRNLEIAEMYLTCSCVFTL